MRSTLFYFFCLSLIAGCTTAKQSTTYAVTNVNVITMAPGDSITPNATVIIQNKKISSINGNIPEHATIINGRGKWLIPGLADMHVHNLTDLSFTAHYPTKGATLFFNTQDLMLPYIANGVTTVFELSAKPEHFSQRNEISKGNVIGPRMALALLIDGGEGTGTLANTPEEGRQTVRVAKAEGYEFIKVYSHLSRETFTAIVDEANKQGMKVIGHIPDAFKGHLQEAFIPNFDMVAHAEEFSKQATQFSDEEAKQLAQLAKQNGTWLSPTLVTMVKIEEQVRSLDSLKHLSSLKYVHPLLQSKWITSNNYNRGSSPERIQYFQKLNAFHKQLVKAFREAGVPMVAGTDAGTSGVVWGFSLQDELELLVKAGLTPAEALASATRLPATWLGIADKTGSIASGKFADLVLLDENPLQNISNTRKIAGVFVNGRWLDRKKIDEMLADLASRNEAMKNKFEWSKRREY